MQRILGLLGLSLLLSVSQGQARPRIVHAPKDVNASKANVDVGPLKAHHIALSVPNLDESVRWYQTHLGFVVKQPKTALPSFDGRVALIEKDGFVLELYEIDGSDDEDGTARDFERDLKTQGYRHLAFQVENVDRAAEKLKTQGVRFLTDVMEMKETRLRLFVIADNAGNAIEILQPMPTELVKAAQE